MNHRSKLTYSENHRSVTVSLSRRQLMFPSLKPSGLCRSLIRAGRELGILEEIECFKILLKEPIFRLVIVGIIRKWTSFVL